MQLLLEQIKAPLNYYVSCNVISTYAKYKTLIKINQGNFFLLINTVEQMSKGDQTGTAFFQKHKLVCLDAWLNQSNLFNNYGVSNLGKI